MREIKFRAWDPEALKMFSWEEIIELDEKDLLYLKDVFTDKYNLKLMQYTGFKDKQDKEIYEGDIYKWVNDDDTGRIFYKSGAYWITFDNNDYDLLSDVINDNIEVIGNIFENTELLPPKEEE